MRRRRLRRLGQRLARERWVLGPLLLLLVLELAARGFAPELPDWRARDSHDVVLTGHPTRLWGLSEGVRANAGAKATVNARGFRGALPEQPKTRRRALVLGDSSLFGHGVEDDQTLARELERRTDLEVLNLAVPGYTTEQLRVVLDEEDLEPDLLVVGALWSDTGFDVARDRDLLRARRGARFNPLVHSALFRVIVGALAGDRGRVVRFEKGRTDGPRRVPLEDYVSNLDGFARRGVPVLFLRLCPRFELKRRRGHDWDAYVDGMVAVAAHHAQPLVDGCEAFEAVPGRRAGDLFLDDIHPSAQGHALLGQALAEALEPWPSPSAAGPLELELKDPQPLGPPMGGSPVRNLFPD